MKEDNKDNTIRYVILAIIVFGSLSVSVAIAQQKEGDPVKDTLSVKDTRKSFGYCPDASILDKYGITYSLESCPLSRLYVDHWDTLSATTQQTIYNELLSKGWLVAKE